MESKQYVRDAQGQLYELAPQPVNEEELKAEAADAESHYNDLVGQVEGLEQSLKNAQEVVDTVQAELAAKVQEKADAEAVHVQKSASLDAVTNAGTLPEPEPESDEAEGTDDGVTDGESDPSSSVEAQEVPVSVVGGA